MRSVASSSPQSAVCNPGDEHSSLRRGHDKLDHDTLDGRQGCLRFSVGRQGWSVGWGRYDTFGTAAYWIDQVARGGYAARLTSHAQDADLLSETLFCLLGGYGVTAESAQAAHGVITTLLAEHETCTAARVEEALRQPLPGTGGRYRFPRQRAMRVAVAVNHLRHETPPRAPLMLRDYLMGLPGVGPKTAAWIVRNVTGSAQVAIVDIWLIRALTHIGIFDPDWRVDRHYDRFEAAFLQYASQGGVLPGALDLCIWEQSRRVGIKRFT